MALDMIRLLSTDLIPSRYFISYLLIKVSVKAREHEACALAFLRARLSPKTVRRAIKPYSFGCHMTSLKFKLQHYRSY